MALYDVKLKPGNTQILIAERIRSLRKQHGLTQMALAEKSSVSLGSIKRFERTGQISLKSLFKLIHVLGRLSEVESLFLPNENTSTIEKLFSDKMRGQ